MQFLVDENHFSKNLKFNSFILESLKTKADN